ncbi:MAG: topoisomerase C-terminal repeat-containing protein, partial [Pelistega sp.]|nr:topoisomerase C-terminal repeat-containing protein [Pelistega sp.]
CTDCDFSITKNPGGRNLETEEAEELLTHRSIGPLSGFISKLGRPFSAILRLTEENKLEFDFGQNDETEQEEIDFSSLTALGKCPKCASGHIYDIGMSYVCDQSTNKDKPCDFKSGKVILQQEISQEQMSKLLETGKTDLLEGFVSNRTNRKFKAFLAMDKKGKIGFEFEERGTATKAATKKATKTATTSATKATTAKKATTKTVAKKATKTASKRATKSS